jgi:uncharacterized protein
MSGVIPRASPPIDCIAVLPQNGRTPRIDRENNALAASADTPTARTCPICGKPTEQPFRPFCSRRCADVDLNRWLSGVYSVPVVEEDDLEETEPKRESD